MRKFSSQKVLDGYSCCFRQWKATDTHCQFLHGYAISFEIWFEGNLDFRHWVADFGLFSRSETKIDGMNPKEWFNYMFDHTVIIAEDDPNLDIFKSMDQIIQLRTLPNVGCEMFAKFVFEKLDDWIKTETVNRVKITKVIVRENNKNSASYGE